MAKRILKSVFIVIPAVLLLFVLMLLSFRAGPRIDVRRQEKRIEALSRENPAPVPVPDERLDDGLPINRIRYLATHNSYRVKSGVLQLFFLNLGEPGEAAKLTYSHIPFTDQLDLGIRSFELDPRYRKGDFRTTHVPLVDNRSHSPSLRLALEEMRTWSDRHPAHVPIIIILEIKYDWMVLDPGLEEWTPGALAEMEELIRNELGDRLLTPADIRGASGSLREALAGRGWPELGDCRGSFLFVIHETEADIFTPAYIEDPRRVCFPMFEPGSPEASFFVRNDPTDGEIGDLTDSGFIVRTRADADCFVTRERTRAAVESSAQIVSTDFPAGYPGAGELALSWDDLMEF